jgi:hypothetical protein
MRISSDYIGAKANYNGSVGNADTSFSTQIEKNVSKKKYTSATIDFKKRNPDQAAAVDSKVLAGKNVLRKNGVEKVDRDKMSMDEYKKFFTGLMDSIPTNISQKGDTEVWSITDAGWEQMKNDPDYEAWVLGYTVEDRAVYNPFASMPGYTPSYHTEHFGASIDEHLGQSYPMGNTGTKKSSKDKDESWWNKRYKEMAEIMKQQEANAYKKALASKKKQEKEWLGERVESSQRLQSFLTEQDTETPIGVVASPTNMGVAIQGYENAIDTFSNNKIS